MQDKGVGPQRVGASREGRGSRHEAVGLLSLSSSHNILASIGTTTRALSSGSKSSWDSIMRSEMLSGGSDLAVCFNPLRSHKSECSGMPPRRGSCLLITKEPP